MVNPIGQVQKHGAISPISVHGVKLDEQRWFPVQYLDGGLVVADDEGVLNQDDVDRALIGIDLPHHKVHEAAMFEASICDLALASNGTLIMSTPDPIGLLTHFTFEGACGGDATIELLENPTIAGGAAVDAWNMNRNFPDPAFVPLMNPVLGGAPNVLTCLLLPGGRGGQAGGGSGSSRAGLEWITDATDIYAIRLTNLSGQARIASIVVNFYLE